MSCFKPFEIRWFPAVLGLLVGGGTGSGATAARGAAAGELVDVLDEHLERGADALDGDA